MAAVCRQAGSREELDTLADDPAIRDDGRAALDAPQPRRFTVLTVRGDPRAPLRAWSHSVPGGAAARTQTVYDAAGRLRAVA